jgi:hypothetical protein
MMAGAVMEIVAVCCVCKRIRNEQGKYVEGELKEGQIASHTYCPICWNWISGCFDHVFAYVEDLKKNGLFLERNENG